MSENNIDVSVVIPVYNAAATLDYCITSCLRQEGVVFEVVLVNDGSSDGSLEIIRRYASVDSRVRVVDQPNGGVTCARFNGVAKARGEFLTFLDADDKLVPNALRLLLGVCRDADIVFGEIRSVDVGVVSADTTDSCKSDEQLQVSEYRGVSFLRKILRDNLFAIYGRLFRRDLFRDLVVDPRIRWGEDFVTMVGVALKAKKVYAVNAVVYNYCVNPKSVTRSCSLDVFLTWRLAKISVDKFLAGSFFYSEIERDWIFRAWAMELGGLRIALERFGYTKTPLRKLIWQTFWVNPHMWGVILGGAPRLLRIQFLLAMGSPVCAVKFAWFYTWLSRWIHRIFKMTAV